jgi:hypothetical protein
MKETIHQLMLPAAARTKTGTPALTEVPANDGGPSRTRTLDPLIKSDSESLSTEVHDDVTLEDLYTWE